VWIPLIILIVFATGGFTVTRLHRVFGSEKHPTYADTRIDDAKPFNPKHVLYEVFGPPGSTAGISYFDGDGEPQHVKVPLPWTLEFAIGQTTSAASVVAQSDSDSIGCRISVDGVVKSEKTTHQVDAFTFCILKSA
jgi:Mycobacterium membrane protein